MVFKQFAVDGIVYEERGGFLHELNSSLPVNFEQNKKVLNLLNNLAVCHTVQLDKDNIYQASSPDEYSFIKFCIKLGIVYKGNFLFSNSKRHFFFKTFTKLLNKIDIIRESYRVFWKFWGDSSFLNIFFKKRCTHFNKHFYFNPFQSF